MDRTNLRERVTLGRTGRQVARIGLGSSFGIGASDVEEAYHAYGVNYLYWGSAPRPGFGKGIRNLAKRHREDLVVVLQSYVRAATLIKTSVRVALKRLRLEYADVLLLGLYNKPPARRLLDAAVDLRERGLVRHIAVSAHHRPAFQEYAADGFFDIFHVRYNAAHRGAEVDVFSHLGEAPRPGVVAFTATRWGKLIGAQTPGNDPAPTAADCYRFALSHPSVDLTICGPKNRQQLMEGLCALDQGVLDADQLEWMRRVGDFVHG
jgi:aryl-alcohol dehydrogenase-like predicted oxidoreductase